jgi:hypothetical protein
MYAVIIRNDVVVGYLETTQEKANEFKCDFVLLDELPQEVVDVPTGSYTKINKEDNSFYHVALPPIPKTEQSRITELEQQLAQKTTELDKVKIDMANQTTAILEIYDILGGM